jgi:High potential iron-sulfur protein
MTVSGTQTETTSQTVHTSADVSRRNVLRGATLVAGGAALLAATAMTQRAEAKMAQPAAGYVADSKTAQHCSDCALFQAPSACKLVDGTINPNGWCRFYVKKS